MKRIISTILILSFAFMMISCTSNVINETVPEGTDDTIQETGEVTSESDNSEIGTELSQDTIIGGSRRCKVHYWGYHEVLFDVASLLISEKEAEEWFDSVRWKEGEPGSDCPCSSDYTIWSFVHHFNVPREKFEEVCRNCSELVYNPDVIYNDDPSVADNYYRNIKAIAEDVNKTTFLSKLKSDLIDAYKSSDSERLVLFTTELRVSILTLVQKYNVPRSYFDEYFAEQDHIYAESGGKSKYIMSSPEVRFDFDFSVIYDDEGNIKSYDDKTEYEIDCMFCGVDDFFLDY